MHKRRMGFKPSPGCNKILISLSPVAKIIGKSVCHHGTVTTLAHTTTPVLDPPENPQAVSDALLAPCQAGCVQS